MDMPPGGVKVDGNWKAGLVGACRAQVLREPVTESAFGLPDVEEITSGATDTVGTRGSTDTVINVAEEQFINFANTFHHAFKFTWTISDTSLPFLDLSVSISSNQLTTDIHIKPVDSHNYLNYTSSHPPSCKNAIPYSQILCLNSQDEVFYSRNSQISSYFRDHSFLSSVIKDAIN
eukprot:g27875.t1